MAPESSALAVQPRRAPSYVRHAVLNPISVSTAIFATCVGAMTGGTLGALFVAPVILLAAVGMVGFATVRHAIERHVATVATRDHERARRQQLQSTGLLRLGEYEVLRELVDDIERSDPDEARRSEVQQLLDTFVRIAVVHARCQHASIRATSSLNEPPALHRSTQIENIFTRRIAQRDECNRRLEYLADQLEAIQHLIRLIAQRVACPAIDYELDREIDHRLWELDQVDAAYAQLSA